MGGVCEGAADHGDSLRDDRDRKSLGLVMMVEEEKGKQEKKNANRKNKNFKYKNDNIIK